MPPGMSDLPYALQNLLAFSVQHPFGLLEGGVDYSIRQCYPE